MIREITPGVHWISECYDMEEKHGHVSVYVLEHEDGYLAIDSGSDTHNDAIKDQINKVTNEKGIDTIILSHFDLPHTANVRKLQNEWGDVQLVSSDAGSMPFIHGFEHTDLIDMYEPREIHGRKISFFEPVLADVAHTGWMFDHESGGIFTSDGFGHYHYPGDCDSLSSEIEGGIEYDLIKNYHENMIDWLSYVDPDHVIDALEESLGDYECTYIAPSHGNPIMEAEIEDYREKLERSIREIASEFEMPTI